MRRSPGSSGMTGKPMPRSKPIAPISKLVASWVKPSWRSAGSAPDWCCGIAWPRSDAGFVPHYIAMGELAAAEPEYWYPLEREITAVRARQADVLAERERRLAPFGERRFPPGALVP